METDGNQMFLNFDEVAGDITLRFTAGNYIWMIVPFHHIRHTIGLQKTKGSMFEH